MFIVIPPTRSLREFLGGPAMNLLPATPASDGLMVGGHHVALPACYDAATLVDQIILGIRPEDLVVQNADTGTFRAQIVTVAPLGAETLLTLTIPGIKEDVIVREGRDSRFSPGDWAALHFDQRSIRLFDAATQLALKTR